MLADQEPVEEEPQQSAGGAEASSAQSSPGDADDEWVVPEGEPQPIRWDG
jgi:hypothetical protein